MFELIMIYSINSKSKPLNLKRIQIFLTWFKIPIKLIPINFKWLIVMWLETTNLPYDKHNFTKVNGLISCECSIFE